MADATSSGRDAVESEATQLFLAIGISEDVAKDYLKNRKLRDSLVEVIKEAGAEEGTSKAIGALLCEVANKFPKTALAHRPNVLRSYVLPGSLRTKDQLSGGLEYLKKLNEKTPDWKEFESASGIGVEVTPEEMTAAIVEVLSTEAERINEDRYRSKGVLLGKIRPKIKWADVEAVKAELQVQLDRLLGGITEEDLREPEKKKKKKPSKPEKPEAATAAEAPIAESLIAAAQWEHLGRPEDNYGVHTTVSFSDGRKVNISNTSEMLKEHLAITGGQVRTRFPPEPNGYLHIGHAKAMHVSFGMAEQYKGICFLRFDDTNPEAEKQEYIDHIQDIVSWLGWKPFKVTYSSDYFRELYELAVKLIKSGNAFVCHQTAEEISEYRDNRMPSPWRERPIQESLRIFEEMRMGLYDEGSATLRMKQDVKNENYNMFDLIAYRIKYVPHPKAGEGWCIYPSYDYTHCIVDALEHISHSLCTLEFESRRASYYWLLQALGLYMPVVWEYGRLNLTHNVMSKRKMNKLATGGFVTGWDDPRLLTLAGLRRRGVTPAAINNFCRELGITRSDADIHLHKLEHHVRADLEASSPRALAVLRPLLVVLTNLPESYSLLVEAKVFPNLKESKETYSIHLSRDIWIECTDFRETDSAGYYGLAPNKTVALRYGGYITCTKVEKANGVVTSLEANFEAFDGRKPPKGVLNWVGRPAPGQEPFKFEARLYDTLFRGEDTSKLGDEWIQDLNPASRTTISGAMGTTPITTAEIGARFQFERLGYFCVDSDTTPGKVVINRTVTLKESTSKPKE